MSTQRLGIACTELLDCVSIRQTLRIQPEYRFGEPECRKLGMDLWGVVGGIDLRRIPKRNMPNGYQGPRETPGMNVHDRIDGHDHPFLKDCAIEDRRPRGDKRAPMHYGAANVRLGPHQHVIPEGARMLSRPAEHRVLHNNAGLADAHGCALGANDGPGKHHCTGPDLDITRDARGGRYDGGGIDDWLLSSVCNTHLRSPTLLRDDLYYGVPDYITPL